ncbi:hypothetical protein FE257_003711 [Aspergillus nanangensis]|uniref:Uncharacterized protein n=1 Tax=Aspergillus nanangensis TaxID=2582783 RepID=A0AAD4CS40_ASPNN|nr:hypothetical protein FE257_003711 [Aspergillus nanangensis]
MELSKTSMPALSELQFKPQYPIPDGKHFPYLIHHYCETSFLPTTHREQNSLTAHLHTVWMHRAMLDPCLFHGTLFCASAHLDYFHSTPHSPRTLYHQSQALKLVRERLKGNDVSYEAAATVLALIYYNMSAYNTESALIHRNGLLKILALNQHKSGPDFESLNGVINLILLGFSIVLNQEPPSTRLVMSLATIRPYNLLQRAIERVTQRPTSILTGATISQLRSVLDFIIKTDHVSTDDISVRYTDDTKPMIMPESSLVGYSQTAQNINECCDLAVDIFRSIFEIALYPTSVQAPIDRTAALKRLRSIFQKLDLTDWQKHVPEVYVWVCFTAAAACSAPVERIPYITAPTPLLSASDSVELLLTREASGYFRWLVEFV